MKITLNISEVHLALLWDDTWRDEDARPMSARLAGIIEDEANKAKKSFGNSHGKLADLVAAFRKSNAAKEIQP